MSLVIPPLQEAKLFYFFTFLFYFK